MVPRHDREPDGARDHREGSRGEARGSEEAGSGDRDRTLHARQLPAEHGHHARAQPELFPAGTAVHRSSRDGRGRGQRLPHGGVPLRQVRSGLGVSGHDQPHRLGADQGLVEAEATQSEDGRVSRERHEPHLDAHGPEAVQRRAGPSGDLAGDRPSGHHRSAARGRGRLQSAGAGRAQGVVDPDEPARRRCQVLQGRSRRSEAPARRRGVSERVPGADLLHHVRFDAPGGRLTDGPQEPEGRRDRRTTRSEGVRGVHLDVLQRQVRRDGVRATDALSRSRQLPLRPVPRRAAEEPEPHQ